jgi:hypothetical protein
MLDFSPAGTPRSRMPMDVISVTGALLASIP